MGGLAGADGIKLGARDDLDLHLRHLAETQDRIRRPGVAGDALAVEADLLLQYPAGGLDGAALDLVDHAVRIDGFADIDGDGQPSDPDILRAFDFGDDGAIRAGVLVSGKADAITDAGLLARLPVRAPGDGPDHLARARIGEMTQPKGNRILAAFRGQFVEKGFDR